VQKQQIGYRDHSGLARPLVRTVQRGEGKLQVIVLGAVGSECLALELKRSLLSSDLERSLCLGSSGLLDLEGLCLSRSCLDGRFFLPRSREKLKTIMTQYSTTC
jgi:hypothetical protein